MINSLPTIEQLNLQRYYEVIRRCDPELYLIKLALIESGVNPMIVPKIIRGIAKLAAGTGYGKVQIFIQARIVTQVKGEESTEVNEVALVDR